MLDDARQREICALVSAGCSLRAAAEYIECAPNTIRREAARNPEFSQRFREARLQAQLSPLQAMRKAANSHWRAAAWMLERTDPDHFGRRPTPAFRPKQARALKDDILAILSTEIDNPFLLSRLKKQIKHLVDYSIDGVVKVERTNHLLREAMRDVNEIQRDDENRQETTFDELYGHLYKEPPTAAASPAPTLNPGEPLNPGQPSNSMPPTAHQGHNPDREFSPEDLAKITKELKLVVKRFAAANGQPADTADSPPPDAPP
jgi:hypothetical protein